MRKNLLLLCSFVSLLFVSCGGGSTTGPNGETVVSEQSASCIIDYYNQVVDVLGRTPKAKNFEDVVEYMKNNGRIRGARPSFMTVRVYSDSSKTFAPGTCFSAGARDSLQVAFHAYYDAIKQFDKNYDSFKSYREAEDYKDDNWAKGQQWAAENEELYEQVFAARRVIFSILTPLADHAELILLEDNPYKNYIVMSKGIFEQMETICDEATEDKPDSEAIGTAYDRLEQLVEAGRALPVVDHEKGERKKERFDNYLDAVDEFMGVVRKARRDNRYTASVTRDMHSKYERTISRYNSFVD